jgi:hypothetical protein
MKKHFIKLTSAIGTGGLLYRAGSIIEVSEAEALDLIRRGKGEVATDDTPDVDPAEVTDDADEAPKETAKQRKAREAAEAAAVAEAGADAK